MLLVDAFSFSVGGKISLFGHASENASLNVEEEEAHEGSCD